MLSPNAWPDWLVLLLTRCPWHVRQMGYVRELLGIRQRHRDWGSAWKPHLERTRSFLLQAATRCLSRRKALLIGTGWLYDVPVAELAATFREVLLVDVAHPLGIRSYLRRWPNVRAVDLDVTGTLETAWQAGNVPHAPLPVATPGWFLDDDEVSFTASVNVLSQLPCMPENYLLRMHSHTSEEIATFARNVVRAHLDWLHRLPGVTALVADTEIVTVSRAGTVVRRESSLWGLDLALEGERWTWALLPQTNVPPYHGAHRSVVGVVRMPR